MTTDSNKTLWTYFLVLVPLSGVAEAFIIAGNVAFYPVLMWIPAIAAIAANIVKYRQSGEKFRLLAFLRQSGFRRCGVKYVLLACLLPLVYLLIPYIIYWTAYPDNFAYSGVNLLLILKDCAPVGILGIFLGLLTASGEEIGWRGFMVPELFSKLGLNKTLLLSGLIWCVWHLPLLAFGDYMEGAPLWYALPAFVLCIFPVGVMVGLLALRTGSLWPAAFLHAAHNNFDQSVFGLITRGDNRMFFVSETGFLTVICAWALAAVMYFGMRKKIGNTTR